MIVKTAKILITVVWGFVECMLFGGTIFGWPSMVYIMVQDGIFSHVCPLNVTSDNSSWIKSYLGNNSAVSSTRNGWDNKHKYVS